ncbi:MAG: hypothetical protein WBN28_09290 [Lutimonas sp.]
MIPTNIFRLIGEFCTNVLFKPYDLFRSIEGWWPSNAVNFVLISIISILFIYWLGQLQRFRKAGIE